MGGSGIFVPINAMEVHAMTETMNEERLERVRMECAALDVCDLIEKRRPDLYPDNYDVSPIVLGMIERVWKPRMTIEECYATVLPELEAWKSNEPF
jgi:hypothetical protein